TALAVAAATRCVRWRGPSQGAARGGPRVDRGRRGDGLCRTAPAGAPPRAHPEGRRAAAADLGDRGRNADALALRYLCEARAEAAAAGPAGRRAKCAR